MTIYDKNDIDCKRPLFYMENTTFTNVPSKLF